MSVSALLAKIKRLGVRVWAEEGGLRCDAPAGTLTQELRDELQAHKAEILKHLTDAKKGSRPTVPALRPTSRAGKLPLSYAQQRLWFMDQLVPDSPFYNIPAALRFQGDLDRDALQRCFDELVVRHETLRTTFPDREGEPVQMIMPSAPVELPLVDLTGLAPAEREAEAERVAAEDAQCPFSLQYGPLFRVRLLRLDEQDHVLLLNMHHIVSDGFSYGVLIREMSALYEAYQKGKQSPLPALALQYVDFAVWQRQWLQGEAVELLLNHWKRRLEGAATLQLPTDHQRPAVQTFRGARETFVVSNILTKELESLSRRERATLFMTLLAAFKVLLHRYTGQEDIVVGSPIANRNRPEIEGLIGFFANNLVIRTDVSGQPSFRALLRRVREVALDAYQHQDLPFERLVEALGVERDLSRNPLFQVFFALQNAPMRSLELSRLSVSWLPVAMQAARSDLEVYIWRADTGLHISVIYNSDLFDQATIRRLGEHYGVLLESIVSDPDQRISTLQLMSPREQHQLLCEWNKSDGREKSVSSIHGLFEAQVDRTPDAIAVLDQERQLTYRELNIRANQLAHHLQSLGAGAEKLVAICVDRCLEMVVGLLGILKSGAAYVPLDPDYPQERLAFMLQDSEAAVLVTRPHLLPQLPGFEGDIVCLDEDAPTSVGNGDSTSWAADGVRAESDLASNVSPANLAYVIYTSGSTGRPKGVAIEHASAVNLLHWAQETFTADEIQGVLASTSVCFDVSVFELFVPLSWGGTMILAENALQLPELPHANRVALVSTVPSAMSELERMGRMPESIRAVVLAGEPVSKSLAQRIRARQTVRRLFNIYGPTEATVYATSALLHDEQEEIPSIGRPISNTQAYVLDRSLQPVPIGVPGELYLGGDGLARGYVNRAEQTAEKFIANPFDQRRGSRLYRTGDLVRWRADGNLEFLGRMDNQVKIRGYRIELGEIESVLNEHPEVRDAVVLVRHDRGEAGGLVAYIVSDPPSRPSFAQLRSLLRVRLPEYMVPAAFVLLDELPRTPNGKLDRGALPVPEGGRQLDAALVPPESELERRIADIWRQVLGLPEIGVHDSFFELGGHSLLAARVVSRLRSDFQLGVSVQNLFEAPTVSQMAELLEQLFVSEIEQLTDEESAQLSAKGRIYQFSPPDSPVKDRPKQALGDVPRLSPAKRALLERWKQGADIALPSQGTIPRRQNRQYAPLSFAQQRLWLFDQFQPKSTLYNVSWALRMTGPVNVPVLERCLRELVRRHESLRTAFQSLHGRPVQVIAAQSTPVRLSIHNVSHLPEQQRVAEAARRAAEETGRPFDLSTGPLMRTALIEIGQHDHVLVLTMHHIVTDAWSQHVFWRELDSLYTAFSQGQPSPLAELPIQYADFAQWQRDRVDKEELKKQMAYWQTQLEGVPPVLDLPTDFSRQEEESLDGAWQILEYPEHLSKGLKALARQEDCTLFMTLLAAFQTLLYRYTGREDIVVGVPFANRNRSETEGLVGFFVNTLPLRTDLSGNPTFRQLLSRVREVARGAQAHEDIPFERIVERVKPERVVGRLPLVQLTLNLVPAAAQQPTKVGDLSLTMFDAGYRPQMDFDLSLDVIDQDRQIRVTYKTELYRADTIRRMLQHFRTLLEAVVSDPDQHLSQLPMLTASEGHQLLVHWNDTAQQYPDDSCVHQLFVDQAERSPDAVALESENQQMSYRELNERSNQLAHHLRTLNVGPETPIGMYLERSFEAVVALLGVLKAGGAYLPLDSTLPPHRVSYILSDASPSVLLSQQRLAQSLPVTDAKVLCLDSDWDVVSRHSKQNPHHVVDGDNLALVIYTSGTTGMPKGVMLVHRALSNHMCWMQSAYPLTEADAMLQKYSLSFDAGTLETLAPLLGGARLVIIPHGRQMDPTYLVGVMATKKVTAIDLVPSLLDLLLREEELDTCRDLRRITCGGEAMSVALRNRCLQRLPVQLANLYGPTEGTIGATYWNCRTDGPSHTVPIGRPIGNTRVYVLDNYLSPVPVGVFGELHLGGVGLARGYLNRPELTAERFIPDPFSEEPGSRLYKTGDRVRFLPDGNLEFAGRIDRQVKIRGYRIELTEIESVLKESPVVRDAIVLARSRETLPSKSSDDVLGMAHQLAAMPDEDARRILEELETLSENETRSRLARR